MSSAIFEPKLKVPSTTLFNRYLVNENEPEEKQAPEVEEPSEQQTAWKPGGFTPSRASWRTVQGRIKRYLA